jgi:glycosyltransferase involved in cell wall biosynthesis
MKRKLHICFVSPKAYPLFNKNYNGIFGGAEVQLYLLAREFAKNEDMDVNFIVADYGQKLSEECGGVTVLKSFKFDNLSLIKNMEFLRCFMRVNSGVYIQRTLDPASGVIVVLCKLLRKQFVYMVAHDMEVDGGYEKNKGMLKTFLANLVFKYADIIIVQNTSQKDLLYKNKGRNSFLIKSGYPINGPFKGRKEDCILWVGRSEQWKQPELFIRLAKLNMGFRFKMICPQAFNDREGWYSSLKKKVLGVENLEFIEYVPFDEIDEYFQKAQIFVNTSIKEGFPNTFIQATKNGTPIISLNVNPDNFLNEYNCGFFCNNDFNKLNNELNLILSDRDLYKRMSDNAYSYAKENHDIEKNAEELYRLILDLKC